MKKLILLMTILGAFSMNVYSQDNTGEKQSLVDCGDGVDADRVVSGEKGSATKTTETTQEVKTGEE